ncbi:hypothetical protein OYC64_003325 [Pagothenia borchgrevinki]|uniref:DM domain-containing protein n=1 Tax=Pagothenia borchgrevinki TaxID=8213 RepID=A0ABD2FPH2_PAGBO
MSLSKEHLPVASTAGRQPKCTRCRHHGIIVPQKGHVKSCPFVTCECWKCYLITQRTRITAVQRNLKKVPNKEQPPSAVKRQAEGTFTNSAPEGGARPSGTYGLMCPPSDGAPERAASTAWSPHDPPGAEPTRREGRRCLVWTAGRCCPSLPVQKDHVHLLMVLTSVSLVRLCL